MAKAGKALEIPTPRWALPLLEPAPYKGAYGGRSAGKSHFFAERVVEEMICDPDLPVVCIREVQQSLKHSAKRLIEAKIREMGVADHFEILATEIRRVGGEGIILFQGMQDHTAESIKSLEGFRIAWVEEAHSISERSLSILLPTIREAGSEIWFSWNPSQPTDPVDRLMRGDRCDPDQTITVRCTYRDNPWVTDKTLQEVERHRRTDPDTFDHVWLGEYVEISDAIIFAGHWTIEEFEPGPDWDGPYYGLDWGFANDPTAAVKVWIFNGRLFIEHEAGRTKLTLDKTADYLADRIPGIAQHTVRADSAQPASIKHVQDRGLPGCTPVKKWQGSVEDGIAYMKSFDEIVVHPRCEQTASELRKYRYEQDRLTGDPKPKVFDAYNHFLDATRYALQPMIRRSGGPLLGRA